MGSGEEPLWQHDAQKFNGEIIAAVIENRAKEVGIAIFVKAECHMILTQLIETSRYRWTHLIYVMATQASYPTSMSLGMLLPEHDSLLQYVNPSNLPPSTFSVILYKL